MTDHMDHRAPLDVAPHAVEPAAVAANPQLVRYMTTTRGPSAAAASLLEVADHAFAGSDFP